MPGSVGPGSTECKRLERFEVLDFADCAALQHTCCDCCGCSSCAEGADVAAPSPASSSARTRAASSAGRLLMRRPSGARRGGKRMLGLYACAKRSTRNYARWAFRRCSVS